MMGSLSRMSTSLQHRLLKLARFCISTSRQTARSIPTVCSRAPVGFTES